MGRIGTSAPIRGAEVPIRPTVNLRTCSFTAPYLTEVPSRRSDLGFPRVLSDGFDACDWCGGDGGPIPFGRPCAGCVCGDDGAPPEKALGVAWPFPGCAPPPAPVGAEVVLPTPARTDEADSGNFHVAGGLAFVPPPAFGVPAPAASRPADGLATSWPRRSVTRPFIDPADPCTALTSAGVRATNRLPAAGEATAS